MDTIRELKEKDKILLMRWHDNSLNFIGRWKVQRLLSNNSCANDYIEELQSLNSKLLQQNNDNSHNIKIDLWDNISNRIEQEEQAAFYLGQRSFDYREEISTWNRVKQSWVLGIPAGALATLVITFAINNFSSGVTSNNLNMASNKQLELNTVAIPNIPYSLQSAAVQPVANKKVMKRPTYSNNDLEVDWLRSDGRVQMIQKNEQSLPIIWIKREEALRRMAKKTFVIENNPNNIRILDRQSPVSISVNNEISR
jgi:hypothetical protein